MIRPETLRLQQIRTLLNLRHPSLFYRQSPKHETHLVPYIYFKALIPSSIFSKSISLSSLFRQEEANEKSKKPLETLFTEAVGFEDVEDEKEKLKKNLRKLEVELRKYEKDSLKERKALDTFFAEAVGLSKKGQNFDIEEIENEDQESLKGLKNLSNLFSSTDQRGKSRKEYKKVEEPMEFKELSPDMAAFAKYLHTKGYLINANFLPNNKFDVSCFVNNYGREFLKFAAEKFAKDHREIYKWLPNSDLKSVAQFGCPSLGRKNVFSAKAMRLYFGIREETVCNKCTLKESCKFANQSVWKKGAKNMDLTVVMRVITLYALEAGPTQLDVPDELKNAVNRLLKKVIHLSEIDH